MMNINQNKTSKAILKHVLLIALCLLYMLPLYALALASFRPGSDLLRYGITLQTLIPSDLNLVNFRGLFTIRDGIYFTWYGNSLLIMFIQSILALFEAPFVAYGLSVYRFKGRKIVTTLVIFLMLVPIQILILPLYKLMISVKLMDRFLGVFLPMIVSPFAIFFFKQYIEGLPHDLIDAGRVDGLSEYAISQDHCPDYASRLFCYGDFHVDAELEQFPLAFDCAQKR